MFSVSSRPMSVAPLPSDVLANRCSVAMAACRPNADGSPSRRKSPKHESLFYLFEELVSFPDLIGDQNFSLEVLFVQEEEIRCDDGKGSRWRQGWSIRDRKLVDVKESRVFHEVADFQALLPPTLPDPFSTRDLSQAVNTPRWLAQKMAFCLRRMGAVEQVGKERNALLYSLPFAKGPLANRR